MIGIIFEQLDGNIIEIRISGNDLKVRSQQYGSSFFPIKTCFNYRRCIKTYPEIEGKSTWRDLVDEILKSKLNSLLTEVARFRYVMREFEKQGFRYIAHQREGHRIRKDGKA